MPEDAEPGAESKDPPVNKGQGSKRSIRDWFPLWEHLPVLISAGGALMYAFLLFGYQRFYGSFHLDPQEVGIGYADVLTRSDGAILLSALLVVALVLSANWLRGKGTVRTTRIAIAVLIPLAVVLFTALDSIHIIAHRADTVKCGIGATPVKFWFFPLFDLRSEPAQVQWIGSGRIPPMDLSRDRLVYLGQANGESLFWDVTRRRTWQVTSTEVSVIINAGPGKCPG
jgi:hypothetical protein